MSAGHSHHPAVPEHLPTQPLGSGHIVNIAVKYRFDFRIATGHGVADEHKVRLRLQVIRAIPFHQADTLSLQLSAHGRINALVGAGHGVAQLPGQNRQAAHEGATDSEDMNVHSATALCVETRQASRIRPTPSRATLSAILLMKIAGDWRIICAIIEPAGGSSPRWPSRTHSTLSPAVSPPSLMPVPVASSRPPESIRTKSARCLPDATALSGR